MDPLSPARPDIRITTLDQVAAAEHGATLIGFGADLVWDTWTTDNLLRELPDKWTLSLLAWGDSRPVAYAIASRKSQDVHLHHIVVSPRFRGTGVGTRMVGELLARAKLAGASGVTLKVARENPARALYGRMGFRFVAEAGEDLLLLRRPSSGRRVAIQQPNYAPWAGYFAKMSYCDTFVLLDDVQMPQGRSWIHRTQIPAGEASTWLSVPVARTSGQLIMDVAIADQRWGPRHLATLHHRYSRAHHYEQVRSILEPIYSREWGLIAELNVALVRTIASFLGLTPEFRRSSEFALSSTSDSRLIDVTRAVGGATYVSGAGGEKYQDPVKFAAAEVQLEVRRYTPVPYAQGGTPFIPGQSILDALFRLGPAARDILVYPES